MFKALIIIVLFYCSIFSAYSQKILTVDRVHGVKRTRFYDGQQVKFKTKSNLVVSGTLIELQNEYLVVETDTLFLSDISTVYLMKAPYGLMIVKTLGWIGGLGYFAIDTGNRLINNEKPYAHKNTYKTAFYFLGASSIAHLLIRKKIKIKKPLQIKVIDISI